MCIHRLLKYCGFFPDHKLPSFADNEVAMDHSHDEILQNLFKKIQPPKELSTLNPAPELELKAIPKEKRGEAVQRNFLLLSRIFIRTAKALKLKESFKDIPKIRVLDVGCGNAPNLLGILALLGINNVEYVGVDNNPDRIAECKKTYQNIENITFISQDALKMLKEEKYQNSFNLVLIQHPNIESLEVRHVFANCFAQAQKVLAQGGILYSTFYYERECQYFYENILPMQGAMQGRLVHSNCFSRFLLNRNTGQAYVPENYTFISDKKNTQNNDLNLRPKNL